MESFKDFGEFAPNQGFNENAGAIYPYVQWQNGDPKLNVVSPELGRGTFMLKAANYRGTTNLPWRIFAMPYGDKTEDMYIIPATTVFHLMGHRQIWEVKAQGAMYGKLFPSNQYEQAVEEAGKVMGATVKGITRYMVLIGGLEEAGLFVLSVKGQNGKGLRTAVSQYNDKIYKPVNAAYMAGNPGKGALPSYAIGVTFAPGARVKASAVANAAYITPPVLGVNLEDPNFKAATWAQAHLISAQGRSIAASLWEEAKRWESEPIGQAGANEAPFQGTSPSTSTSASASTATAGYPEW